MPERRKSRKEIDAEAREMHPDMRAQLYALMRAQAEAQREGKSIFMTADGLKEAARNFRRDVERQPSGAVLPLDVYHTSTAVSSEHGFYPKAKPFLNIFSWDQGRISNENIHGRLLGPLGRLAVEIPDVSWALLKAVIREGDSETYRFMIFNMTRERAIAILDTDSAEQPRAVDVVQFQRFALQHIAGRLAAFLAEDGMKASYPRFLTKEEMEARAEIPDPSVDNDLALEMRYGGKDFAADGYSEYIEAKAQSPIEKRLAGALILQGITPLLQVKIPDPDYNETLSIPDLVIPLSPSPLLVYADGAAAHGTKDAQTHDKRVDRRLAELGYDVLRVSGSDIYSNIERTVEDVKGRIFGREARILTEVFWVEKIRGALGLEVTPSQKKLIEGMLEKIQQGHRVTVKEEKYLNATLNKLGVERTYSVLDDLHPAEEVKDGRGGDDASVDKKRSVVQSAREDSDRAE